MILGLKICCKESKLDLPRFIRRLQQTSLTSSTYSTSTRLITVHCLWCAPSVFSCLYSSTFPTTNMASARLKLSFELPLLHMFACLSQSEAVTFAAAKLQWLGFAGITAARHRSDTHARSLDKQSFGWTRKLACILQIPGVERLKLMSLGRVGAVAALVQYF